MKLSNMTLVFCLVICLWFTDKGRADDAHPSSAGVEQIIGTWELVHPGSPPTRQIKIINPTHYTWVTYDRRTGRMLYAAGGTHSLEGKVYKAQSLYGLGTLAQQLVGHQQVFEAKFQDDKWFHSGTLSNGFQVRETWKRVEDKLPDNTQVSATKSPKHLNIAIESPDVSARIEIPDPDTTLSISNGGRLVLATEAKSQKQFQVNLTDLTIRLPEGGGSVKARQDGLTVSHDDQIVLSITRKPAPTNPEAIPESKTSPAEPVRPSSNASPEPDGRSEKSKVVNPETLLSFDQQIGRVVGVAFLPDSRHAVTGSWNGFLHYWDVVEGNELSRIRVDRRMLTSLALSPDGKQVVCGHQDGKITLWNLAEGKQLSMFQASKTVVSSLAFAPDGESVLCADRNGNVSVWDVKNGRTIRSWDQPMDVVEHVAFSPDGRLILAAGGYIYRSGAEQTPGGDLLRVWDMKNGEVLFQVPRARASHMSSADFSPDGRLILAPDPQGQHAVNLWDLKMGGIIRQFGPAYSGRYCQFSPDGKSILVCSGSVAQFYDVRTERPIAEFRGHDHAIMCSAISPDGKYVLTGDMEGIAKLWQISK